MENTSIVLSIIASILAIIASIFAISRGSKGGQNQNSSKDNSKKTSWTRGDYRASGFLLFLLGFGLTWFSTSGELHRISEIPLMLGVGLIVLGGIIFKIADFIKKN